MSFLSVSTHLLIRLRLLLGLFLACAALGTHGRLSAQSFSLAVDSLRIATFSGRNATTIEIPILGAEDPAFNTASLNVWSDAPGWLATSFTNDRRAIRVTAYYGQGQEISAQVTVRTATHLVTLPVDRLCIANYDTPKTLLSADRTKIYALYKDTVLLVDARTQNVLARANLPLPAGYTFPYDHGRSFSFSENAAEVRVHLSGCPTLFRLSPANLSSLGHRGLPPAEAATAQRVYAGERDGRLYFVRYGARTNPEDGSYQKHYQSGIDVVSLASGALLQSYSFPGGEQLATIEDLALHPDRAELWVRERRRVYQHSSTVWLRRLALDAAGLVQGEVGTALRIETGEHSYYGNAEPWSDSVNRLLLRRDAARAIMGNKVVDARAEPPALLPNLPILASFLRRDQLAASSTHVVRLDTNETYGASILGRGRSDYSPVIVGLSEDGRDALALDSFYEANLPFVVFLPTALAAQKSNQVRSPADGQSVAPTNQLSWRALPGADHYRVFLSSDAAAIAAAAPAASLLVGEPLQASLTLSAPLAPGATYHWRVDAIFGDRTVTGTVQSFSVSHARMESLPRQVATLVGARRRDFSFPVVTSGPDTAWELVSNLPWLEVRSGSGVGPGTVELSVDALNLPAGNTSVTLSLVTDAGSVPVPVRIQASVLRTNHVTLRPGHARLFAVGPSVDVAGQLQRLLCTIDTESEQILRCVAVPATTLQISDGLRPSCAGATSPLHVFESGNRLGEFDPDTLALQRVITLPNLQAWGTSAAAVRPADAGRLWVLHQNNTLTRLAASGAAYDLVLNVPNAYSTHLAENGTTLYTFTIGNLSPNYPQFFTLRRYDLAGAELTLTAERTVPYESGYYYHEVPSLASFPTRLSYRGVVYDENLAPVSGFDDVLLSVSSGGSGLAALSSGLLHLGEDYSEAHILPRALPAYGYKVYEPESRKVVLSFEDAPPRFIALGSLTAARAGTLQAAELGDVTASLRWQEAPRTGDWRSYEVSHRFAYRRAGSDEPWVDPFSYHYSPTSPPFTLSGLSPETTYEVRTRASSSLGIIGRWSEPFSFTTATARPTRDAQAWPQDQSITLGAALSLPLSVTGKDLVWEATGLPPGLALNPVTGTIEGVPTEAGSYRVSITVRNAGGSITHGFSLRVPVREVEKNVAVYTGLLDPNGGPVMGVWQARRQGSVLTGTYRSPLFTRSFRAVFGAPLASSYPTFTLRRTATSRVTYQGVRIALNFTWDLELDRIRLYVWTEDAETGFSADTLSETGRASYWALPAAPHPAAGRYTGLLLPGEYEGPAAPAGAGFFTLDVRTDGLAILSGESALGQKFTQSLPLSHRHDSPFFYFSGITIGFGAFGLTDVGAGSPRLAGEWLWALDEAPRGKAYRAGFAQQLVLVGAPLPPTGRGLPPLAPLANAAGRADFLMSEGGLARLSKPIAQSLTPTATALLAPRAGTAENPHRVGVKLDLKTGNVAGGASILHPNTGRVVRNVAFRGKLVKDLFGDGEDVIGGYFLLPDAQGLLQSGRVEISEPEPAPPAEEPAP